jgi:hypothetical protein
MVPFQEMFVVRGGDEQRQAIGRHGKSIHSIYDVKRVVIPSNIPRPPSIDRKDLIRVKVVELHHKLVEYRLIAQERVGAGHLEDIVDGERLPAAQR